MKKESLYMRPLLHAVRRVNKLELETKEKRLQFWFNRSKHLFSQNSYNMAYEYVAMIDLNLVLDLDKDDSFRLKMWRIFVTDFRRAFSIHEYELFQSLND